MDTIETAIFLLGILGFVSGLVLGYTSTHCTINNDLLIDKVNKLLPQVQCRQCGYMGCYPYAKAVVTQEEKINLCAPGGKVVMLKIANLLNININTNINTNTNYENVINSPRILAIINEDGCIGCTRCILECPVDAIVGAMRVTHTVVSKLCTGCKLCATNCPTQCIEFYSADTTQESLKQDLKTISICSIITEG